MSWEAALDALGTTEAWEPPADLGPLPAALAPRAREVLARLGDEIRGLEERQAAVGLELAKPPPLGTGEPPTPRFLDTTA